MDNNESILSDIIPEETEVSFLQGFLTRVIDIALEVVLIFLFYLLMPHSFLLDLTNSNSFIRLIIVIVIAVAYQFCFLFLFNKTVGMMVCQVKYLNGNLHPLSTKQKLISPFRGRDSSIRFYKDN